LFDVTQPSQDLFDVTQPSQGLFDVTKLSQEAVVRHPQYSLSILKRIPRGARPASADTLSQLLTDIIQDADDVTRWEKL